MPVGRQIPGPLWVDGSISLRVREKRQRTWRMVKVRRPYLVIGRHPRADLVIDRPDVADHHVFGFLDARGLFGVDLRTERGTRFAGSAVDAAWLGSGDLIEVADHAIEILQLRVNGAIVSGPLADDDPLGLIAPDPSKPNVDILLRLANDANTNWSIGSSLVFLGRGPACAVELTDPAVGATHSALLRSGRDAFLIQFPGQSAALNDRPAPPAVRLADADVVTIGSDALRIETHAESPAAEAPGLADLANRLGQVVGPEHPIDAEFTFGFHQNYADGNPVDYPSLLGRIQAETAAIIGVLLRRIEALDEEMAALRDRLDASDRNQAPAAPPVAPLRWDLIPQAELDTVAAGQSGPWLVERLRHLEAERRSTWTNLISRVTPPRPADAD